jgi:pyrimidine-nucleoside phosphorylase
MSACSGRHAAVASRRMRFHPARLNEKKREGGELAVEEIRDLVDGVVDGSLHDGALGAFLMAVCIKGMTPNEVSVLARAMRDSGRILPRLGDAPRIDKHSTGGVGDKTSLILAPLLAACGVHVPMISGRGLGHTGGTIDKLEAIPGYRTQFRIEELDAILGDCGFFMASAGPDIAPADRRMYALRDISGTVPSVPLITSSILSKKLAENLDGLVMDVKVGRAAFMPAVEDADRLMDWIVDVCGNCGLSITALRTDMDHPLGSAMGNALEVREVLDCCRGQGDADLMAVTMALAVEMVLLSGIDHEASAARQRLQRLLDSGEVLRRLEQNIELQGGDPRIVTDTELIGRAPCIVEVEACRDGLVADVDPLRLGAAVVDLGGGRRRPEDRIDSLVGILLKKAQGQSVARGEPIAEVHARNQDEADRAVSEVMAAMPIGDEARSRSVLVQRRVSVRS